MIRVFIGYDPKEAIAFHVLSHSILSRSTTPVSITPLVRGQLGKYYTRQRGPMESTEFSMTRFLVPALSDYTGWSLYMDCDMLCLTDIARIEDEIWENLDKSVLVCQHDYTPAEGAKFLGQPQTVYPRKNWSSLMIFNNEQCRALTPSYVNIATGLELHRFLWTQDAQIGTLPVEWNWLVGEYPHNPNAKILHYTLGGPWFSDTRRCDHAADWLAEYKVMTGQDFYPTSGAW